MLFGSCEHQGISEAYNYVDDEERECHKFLVAAQASEVVGFGQYHQTI